MNFEFKKKSNCSISRGVTASHSFSSRIIFFLLKSRCKVGTNNSFSRTRNLLIDRGEELYCGHYREDVTL